MAYLSIIQFQALDRLSVLEVATANARAENSEHALKIDTISKDLKALTKSYLKLRSELADFQAKVSFDNAELGGDNGMPSRSYNNNNNKIMDQFVSNKIYVLQTKHLIPRDFELSYYF